MFRELSDIVQSCIAYTQTSWRIGFRRKRKLSRFTRSKEGPYYNMAPLSIVESREISLTSKTNSSDCLGMILGIESTCDETSAAIVKNGNTIISHTIASQASIHNEEGSPPRPHSCTPSICAPCLFAPAQFFGHEENSAHSGRFPLNNDSHRITGSLGRL